jgi:hypothetical protein
MRKLQTEGFYDLDTSPNMTGMVKSTMISWVYGMHEIQDMHTGFLCGKT